VEGRVEACDHSKLHAFTETMNGGREGGHFIASLSYLRVSLLYDCLCFNLTPTHPFSLAAHLLIQSRLPSQRHPPAYSVCRLLYACLCFNLTPTHPFSLSPPSFTTHSDSPRSVHSVPRLLYDCLCFNLEPPFSHAVSRLLQDCVCFNLTPTIPFSPTPLV
jgi:hypothetical protein